jgi:hypothetical protein
MNKKGEYIKSSHFAQFSGPNTLEVLVSATNPSLRTFSSALSHINTQLKSKDEPQVLALRKGENTLDYKGSDAIRSLSLVASGLGIIPIVQILRSVLMTEDVAVDNIDLLWINDNKDDFLLSNEVEILEST